MVEGISDLPTVLTSFDTLAEAQDLLDESGPFAQLFVWPPFYVISVLGIIVGTNSAWTDAMRVRARLTGRFLRRHAGRDEAAPRLARRRADVPQWPLLDGASVDVSPRRPEGCRSTWCKEV